MPRREGLGGLQRSLSASYETTSTYRLAKPSPAVAPGGSPATGPSRNWSGGRFSRPSSSTTGSRTPCAIRTLPGCSREARTSDGSKTSSDTPALRRPTFCHLERERHERRVNLDSVFADVHSRPPASTLSNAGGASEGQLRDIPQEGSWWRVRDSSQMPSDFLVISHSRPRKPTHSTAPHATGRDKSAGQWAGTPRRDAEQYPTRH